MATIQVRDIPDDVYETIRRQAAAAGQSLQAFMREWVIRDARARVRRAAVLDEWARELDAHPTTVTVEETLSVLHEDRQR